MVLIHFIFTFERVKFLLSIGSNLGNRAENLAEACRQIEGCCGTITTKSGIYTSAPWGFSSETWFYNQSVILQTDQRAEDLIQELLRIERQLGRVRGSAVGYQSRLIDIDIIMAEIGEVNTQRLTIPHPRMAERRFVLLPSVEIAAHWKHPILNMSISEINDKCSDKSEVKAI